MAIDRDYWMKLAGERQTEIERLKDELAMSGRADCATQERIAEQDAEIELLKHGCDASQTENERLRKLLHSYARLG